MSKTIGARRREGPETSSWPPLIVVLGPTAVGKTELATRLGEALGAEIVSADSRQVYKYMDIGTAKPTPAQRRRVRHHLVDVVDPDEEYTLAQYHEMAYAAIDGLHAQGKLPLLVGGTGLYVRAVVEGWTVPRAKPDQELRARLYAKAEQEGADAVHAELLSIDPVAAARIDARNVRRVIRALEVYITTGIPISELQKKHLPHYRVLRIGLTVARERLYQRIDERVDGMMAAGLLEEVRGLVALGYGYSLPSMSGLGYRQLGLYLRGEVSLDEAVHLIKRNTRRFVRQQYSWFRLSDESIQWYDVDSDCYGEVCALIRGFVSGFMMDKVS
ncbi:MAG: tRNA (adenosine(37)-N6)-dimethylallyltransferase MiaA [Chloroflexota bacterium]